MFSLKIFRQAQKYSLHVVNNPLIIRQPICFSGYVCISCWSTFYPLLHYGCGLDEYIPFLRDGQHWRCACLSLVHKVWRESISQHRTQPHPCIGSQLLCCKEKEQEPTNWDTWVIFHHVGTALKTLKQGRIIYLLFSTAFMAYSTWNTLPSGEKVEADKSYPVPIELIVLK